MCKIIQIPTTLNLFGESSKYTVVVIDQITSDLIEEKKDLDLSAAANLVRDYHYANASVITFATIIRDGTEEGYLLTLYPPNEQPIEIQVSKD